MLRLLCAIDNFEMQLLAHCMYLCAISTLCPQVEGVLGIKTHFVQYVVRTDSSVPGRLVSGPDLTRFCVSASLKSLITHLAELHPACQ